jgi:hypothetical protein
MNVLEGPFGAGHYVLVSNRFKLTGLLMLISLLGVFAIACGGSSDDDDNGSTGSAPPVSTGATGATGGGTGASGGATGSAGGTGSTATGSSGGGSDLSNIADLTGLQSFRWDITLEGAGSTLGGGVPGAPGDAGAFTAKGAYIAPDQAQVTIGTAGIEYKQTIKGGEQWTTIAGVTTGPVPATSAATDLIYVSTFVDPASVASAGAMDCGGTENVNGVSALRCETTEEVNQQIVAGLAPGSVTSEASYVIWVAQEGNFIVRWEFNAEGTANGTPFEWNFVANIMEVNNVSSIEP